MQTEFHIKPLLVNIQTAKASQCRQEDDDDDSADDDGDGDDDGHGGGHDIGPALGQAGGFSRLDRWRS